MKAAMKSSALAALISIAAAAAAAAAPAAPWVHPPVEVSALKADWQYPEQLPRRFRNHCSFDVNHGRFYCSDHCGIDYQFYFCSPVSFGCCRPNFGYCDWQGHLRCAP
jgi:hypothetical protein